VRAATSLGLLIVAALGATAPAVATINVEAVGAWDGWTRPGRSTEIRLSLVSDTREAVMLEVTAGAQRVSSRVTVEPGVPRNVTIPMGATERVHVRVSSRPGASDEVETRLALSESPLLAWVALPAGAAPLEGFHRLSLDADAVARESAAFSSIDALVIGLEALSVLDDRQLTALLDFVARCEPTVLVGASPAETNVFESAVGCGGAKFASVATPGDVDAALRQILSARTRTAPDRGVLKAAEGPSLTSWHVVLALLAAAGAAILLTILFTGSLGAAVGVPALSAALLLWIVQSRTLEPSLLVWAETGSGERVAQYTALQQNSITHRGRVIVPIASALAQPRFCDTGRSGHWSWDVDMQRYTSVELQERLFGNVDLCYEGHFPVARSAEMLAGHSENPTIRNTGSAPWPAGTVAWNGMLHRVDRVELGASVALKAASGSAPRNGVEREAVSRTPFDGASILWPLDLTRTEQLPARAQAWVLMHVGQAGGNS
jgi:hypothetical protein